MDPKVRTTYLYMLRDCVMGFYNKDLELIKKYRVSSPLGMFMPIIDLDSSPDTMDNFKWTPE